MACTERYEAAGYLRPDALREMFRHYIEYMDENVPVHEWPLPDVVPQSGSGDPLAG